MVGPVTCCARPDDRKTTMSATSSGVCQRLSGTTDLICAAAQSSYLLRASGGWRLCQARQTGSLSGVFTMPGQTVLTRIPYGARSRARHWAKLILAAFEAL